MADCVLWLREAGLARDGHSLQPDPARDPAGLLDIGNPQVLGIPSHRAGRMRKANRDLLQQRYRNEHGKPQPSAEALNNLWNEWKNPASAVRQLDLARLPADALAFYRPFHFSPHEEWGSTFWWSRFSTTAPFSTIRSAANSRLSTRKP
ncbi:MAG: hypothetical protein M3Y27_10675 [Acidobacteriota bacterium]|nr:hypothetical protein [Acidobacteriota bacterium]